MERTPQAQLAVVGGSGLYALPGDARRITVATPFGPPSDDIAVGEFAGTRVAFLARHGTAHTIPPHRVDHRANAWALAHLGVRAVFATSAVGSLDPALRTESLVVPDQILDRSGRADDSFYDGADVQHLPFAEPFCPGIRSALAAGVRATGEHAAMTATAAVIRGPRFSTRAESRALRAAGADLVNMTLYPEAALAAELGMGYASLAFVTDMDAGVEGVDEESVTAELVLRRLAEARPRLITVLEAAVRALPDDYSPRQLVPRESVLAVLALSRRWPA